jgi:hypothetical protein
MSVSWDHRRRRSAPAARGRRCREATMVRDYLFLRQTEVAKYFNRVPWQVSVTGGRHFPLVVSVVPALPTAGLHARPYLRVHPGRSSPRFTSVVLFMTHSSPFMGAISASKTQIAVEMRRPNVVDFRNGVPRRLEKVKTARDDLVDAAKRVRPTPLRSGIWPSVASPDEYDAALERGRRSDTPWRPAEQSSKREGCS